VLSIKESLSKLDQLDALHGAAAKALTHAIESSAHYAVDVNTHYTGELRRHLELLAGLSARVSDPQEYEAIRSSFRGELRNHRDKSQEELLRLRGELAAAVKAMQAFADGVASGGEEYKDQIRGDLDRLRSALQADDLAMIRGAAEQTIQVVWQHCGEMHRSSQVVVTQLQDEIRSLHQAMEKERQAMYLDRSSGVWNRNKINARIEDLVRMDDSFCLLFIGIRNLGDIHQQYSRTMEEESLKAMLKRLVHAIGDDAMIARWSEDVFVAVLDTHPTTAEKISEQVQSKLCGHYSLQESGLSRLVSLELKTGLVIRAKGASAATFFPALGQASSDVVNR
jgi:GGDEF domain-containing protein